MRRPALVAVAAALVAAPSSTAAETVAANAAAPALRVDAAGNAELSWTSGGRRLTALVPTTGRVVAGARLAGADVSRALPGSHVPFQRAIRTAPDGWYYALQSWRVTPDGPVELRFSRWQGVPPDVSLTATETAAGVPLSGRATVDGKPFRPGPRARAYVDALQGGSWTRLGGVPLTAAGSFAWVVPAAEAAASYRVTVAGPNHGATLAPDASAVADAPVQLDPGR